MITYANKDKFGAPPINEWRDVDANEVKQQFNQVVVIDPPVQGSTHQLEAAAEINAAIQANPGKMIRLVSGRYLIDEKIRVDQDYSGLSGEGMGWSHYIPGELTPEKPGGTVLIPVTPDIDCIDCSPVFVGLKQVTSQRVVMIGNTFKDFSIDVHPDVFAMQSDIEAAGLGLRQLRSCIVENVHVWNMPRGMTVSGVQSSWFNQFRLFARDGAELGEGSAGLLIRQQPIVDGSVDCWENRYLNWSAGVTSGIRESCVKILRGDGEVFVGGYVNGGKLANIIIEGDAVTNKSILHLRFIGHRFDSTGSNNPYKHQVLVRHQAGYSNTIHDIKFARDTVWNTNSGITTNGITIEGDCIRTVLVSGQFNAKNSIVRALASLNANITVSDVELRNHSRPAITGTIAAVNAAVIETDKTDLPLDGLAESWFIVGTERSRIVSNTATDVTLAAAITAAPGDAYTIQAAALIDVEDVKCLTVQGIDINATEENMPSIIELNGTIGSVNINGNNSFCDVPDIINNATITDFAMGRNTSVYNNDKTKSWRNRYISFTPQIEYGTTPGTTPPTYSVQRGDIFIDGKIATIRIAITLTAKGNGTGNVRIIGSTVVGEVASRLTTAIGNIDAAVVVVPALLINNSGQIRATLNKQVAGAFVSIPHTDINDDTSFILQGSYILP